MSRVLRLESNNPAETQQLAKKLAQQLTGGELIELTGDVGMGKTVFVKGLAQGLGSGDEVTSPTFKLKNIYQGRLELQHLDLYRLSEPGLIAHEITETKQHPRTVVVIEWAGIAEDILPEDRIIVRFSVDKNDVRILKIEGLEQ